ncbi:MAG TPA: glycerate kinase [Bacteroidales bacterium]|nr:glycerate kinase [Bacteroidales bacterium]
MNILICPDKFKESLTAAEAADSIQRGILKALPEAQCKCIPVADGGEGTVQALVKATGGRIVPVKVHDPLLRIIDSYIGVSGDHTKAFIEMSAASGLALLPLSQRDPLKTSTFGTGELILAALEAGCREIILGIGGSATVDGGTGMAQALGVRFLDAAGNEIQANGRKMGMIAKIDVSHLDARLEACRIEVASDVTNVLYGKEGAAFVFGPQKGADREAVDELDENLQHLAEVIQKQLHKDVDFVPGAGAAGGLGAGIMAFLNGNIRKGFELVAEVTGLGTWIDWADMVVTGEGKIDSQTLYGKAPAGVAKMAKSKNKPVIAFAGALGEDYDRLYEKGFLSVIPIADKPMTVEESMKNASVLLERAAERTFRMLGHRL